GSYVTNAFTKRICSHTTYGQMLERGEENSAAFPAVFWAPTRAAIASTRLARQLMLVYLLGLLWLDFAIFADITSSLIPAISTVSSSILLFLVALPIAYFTLRFGMRGVVFADLFQSPIIALGTAIVTVGALFTTLMALPDPSLSALLQGMTHELTAPR